FGRPTVLSVKVKDGKFHFDQVRESESVSEVLAQVDFKEMELFDEISDLADEAHSAGLLSVEDRKAMLQLFGETLNSSTYLENTGDSDASKPKQTKAAADPQPLKTGLES
ncbi:MAG: hypothetical protein AAF491_01660, partial [Verrucomicrobiota bacterium]